MADEKTIIQFTAKVAPYNPGEMAGFDQMTASEYVAAGHATYVSGPEVGSGADVGFNDPVRVNKESPDEPRNREPSTGLQIEEATAERLARGGSVDDSANVTDEDMRKAGQASGKPVDPSQRTPVSEGPPNDKMTKGPDTVKK